MLYIHLFQNVCIILPIYIFMYFNICHLKKTQHFANSATNSRIIATDNNCNFFKKILRFKVHPKEQLIFLAIMLNCDWQIIIVTALISTGKANLHLDHGSVAECMLYLLKNLGSVTSSSSSSTLGSRWWEDNYFPETLKSYSQSQH